MNREELSKNIAFTSIAIGKVMNSIGQTPIKNLDRETQDQLVFLGSSRLAPALFLRNSYPRIH
ncbi:MAG: hypothetical protein ABF629_07805 [Sporolactobacillus sp.]